MDPTLAPPSPGRDSAGIRIVESAEPAWLEPWTIGTDAFLRVGDVPGRAEHELHQVRGALRSEDGGLLIANGGTNELRRYSATGEYVSAAGGTGQGPGEFVELTLAFRQEDDSIAVYDSRERRLSLFAPDGGFVRTVPFDSVPSSVQLPLTRWPDGSYPFANRDVLLLADLRAQGATRIERKGRELTRYWPEGGRQQVASLPGMELVVGPRGGPLPFGRNTAVAAAAGRWIAADNARYELQFRSPDGAVTLLARMCTMAKNARSKGSGIRSAFARNISKHSWMTCGIATLGHGGAADAVGRPARPVNDTRLGDSRPARP